MNIAVGTVLLPVEFVYIVHALTGGDELLEIVDRYRNPAGDVVRIGIVFGVLVCPERFVRAAVACVLDIFQISCGKTCGSVDFYADPPAVLISADGRIRRIPVKGYRAVIGNRNSLTVAVVNYKAGIRDDFDRGKSIVVLDRGGNHSACGQNGRKHHKNRHHDRKRFFCCIVFHVFYPPFNISQNATTGFRQQDTLP